MPIKIAMINFTALFSILSIMYETNAITKEEIKQIFLVDESEIENVIKFLKDPILWDIG